MSYLSNLRELVGSRMLFVPSVAAVIHNGLSCGFLRTKANPASTNGAKGGNEVTNF